MKYGMSRERDHSCGRVISHSMPGIPGLWVVVAGTLVALFLYFSISVAAHAADNVPPAQAEAAIQAVKRYAAAVADSNPVQVAQNDFVCLMKMVQSGLMTEGQFPPSSDPIYSWCWERLVEAHAEVIERKDHGLDELWPGVGQLVNFADFKRFLIAETQSHQMVPSFFVMGEIGAIAGAPGYALKALGTGPLPHASFKVNDEGHVIAVPTAMVRTRVSYQSPITSPAANAPGQKDWAVPYKKPIHPVKAVKVNWVVLSNLRQHGFPVDSAVLNIPIKTSFGTTIPFVIEAGGFEPKSTEFWTAQESRKLLDDGVVRASTLSTRRERIAMLNRILVVDPSHLTALQAITKELYVGLLAFGESLHGIRVNDTTLAQRFNEMYWTVISQTDRMDISLHMEMGGRAEPTPADFLYRMIPAMEALADLQPGDFDNRLKLSLAYRWTNDQLTAIMAPQQLLSEVPTDQVRLRAQILLALAWSRISKVAWNRHFDDPDIMRGYEEAEEAFKLSDDPMDKFMGAYAKAYSMAFRPRRDNPGMLKLLTEAKRWYMKVPGSTEQSWDYFLHNDTLKGIVETDPSFRSLMASSS